MPLPEMNVHCISADLPALACGLVEAECALQQAEPGRWAVLDLSGEQWLEPAIADQSYGAVPYALALWQHLEPRLDPWLELLQLQGLEPLLIPPLPGVDLLLRCLCLAEALERNRRLTVLLPAPAEALALLELARTGPALVDTLLEPLLAWWDQTRQSLASLELVLRLKLPASTGLRLDQAWRARLERLAERLAPDGPWQLTLVLECHDPQSRLLRQRLCGISLRGFLPSRLGLHGAGAQAVLADPPEWWPNSMQGMELAEAPGEALLQAFLRQPSSGASQRIDAEGSRLLLPMAGLLKAQLEVQQIGSVVALISGGQRRLVAVPEGLQGKRCSGARLEGGWLELRFA